MKLALSSPWATYYRQINALFGSDPEIKVVYGEGDGSIRMYVDNPVKAVAISNLLPMTKTFGNVTVSLTVIPSNKEGFSASYSTYEDAFTGNPAFKYVKKCEGAFMKGLVYVVFKNEVVQYFNDNLADIHGLCSTLYENIAREILINSDGAMFCTDIPEGKKIGMPLGEWP